MEQGNLGDNIGVDRENHFLRGRFQQHYVKLLCTQIPKAQKNWWFYCILIALLGYARILAAHKMLVKLTSGDHRRGSQRPPNLRGFVLDRVHPERGRSSSQWNRLSHRSHGKSRSGSRHWTFTGSGHCKREINYFKNNFTMYCNAWTIVKLYFHHFLKI